MLLGQMRVPHFLRESAGGAGQSVALVLCRHQRRVRTGATRMDRRGCRDSGVGDLAPDGAGHDRADGLQCGRDRARHGMGLRRDGATVDAHRTRVRMGAL